RFPKQRVPREHPAIVGETDKARRIQNIVIAEADDDGEENRAAGEEGKTDNPWRSAEPATGPLRAEVAAAGSFDYGLVLVRVLVIDSPLSIRSTITIARTISARLPTLNS